jgi:hypothetical protein
VNIVSEQTESFRGVALRQAMPSAQFSLARFWEPAYAIARQLEWLSVLREHFAAAAACRRLRGGEAGKIESDPDEHVASAIRLVSAKFRELYQSSQ